MAFLVFIACFDAYMISNSMACHSYVLSSAAGMLDMLLGTDLTMTQKDYAQTAQMCGKALITLINDVLDRAKIEAGRLELEVVPFDLCSLMDDVISLFSSKSREKSIEVSYYYNA
jgi:arabidopsis histidine kinase 2/3/4 (cytokinin receptor)